MNSTGTEHSGSVNSPKADGYGFSWNFAMWNMTLNGKKVPALGYLVKNVPAPSLSAQRSGSRNAYQHRRNAHLACGRTVRRRYRIYRVIEGAQGRMLFVDAISGTKNSFELNDLAGDVSYTFVARGTHQRRGVCGQQLDQLYHAEGKRPELCSGRCGRQSNGAPRRMQFFRPQYSRAIRDYPLPCNGSERNPWLACVERCTQRDQLDTDRA